MAGNIGRTFVRSFVRKVETMADNPSFWPEELHGAVSLTFDDGLDTQLDNAIPCLDDCDLKGTFYVNPGRSKAWESQIPRWQQARILVFRVFRQRGVRPAEGPFIRPVSDDAG